MLRDRDASSLEVEEGVTSGDFLFGFLQGTRTALHDKGRQSLTISVERIDPFTIGALIALFERSVGLYASLININAYHQPGVEAGKKAAGAVIELQRELREYLTAQGRAMTAGEIAAGLGRSERTEEIFAILRHLAANPERGVEVVKTGSVDGWRFAARPRA